MKTLIILTLVALVGCFNPIAPNDDKMIDIPQITEKVQSQIDSVNTEKLNGIWLNKSGGISFEFNDTTFTILLHENRKIESISDEIRYNLKSDTIFFKQQKFYTLSINQEDSSSIIHMTLDHMGNGNPHELYRWE